MSHRTRAPISPLLILLLVVALAGCQMAAVQNEAGNAAPVADAADAAGEAVAAAGAQAAVAAGVEIDADTLLQRMADGDSMLVLDVRTPEEYAEGHVPGAVNISHTELGERLDEVRAFGDVDIIVYCRSGRRAGVAREELQAAGLTRLLQLQGDMNLWQERNLPIEMPETVH